jgi:hypothetical protein
MSEVVDSKKGKKAYSKPTKEQRAAAADGFKKQYGKLIEKSRAGRKSVYQPEFCDMLIAFGMTGRSMAAFAGELFICRETLWTWIASYPDFAAAARVFKTVRTNTLERELLETSVGTKVMARLAALKNLNPDDWRDRKEYSIGGNDDLPAIKSDTNLTPSQAYLRALGNS